jgi:N-acetylglucosaminyldiphosphoundecaprenol N-acetyl-beta-D-mannosaminyltransferase
MKLELIEYYAVHLLEANRAFSFINFASIGSFFTQRQDTILYFCDGMLMSSFMSRVTGRSINRVSFDFTSIADPVFSHAQKNAKPVYFVGAQHAELSLFIDKMKARYPNLIIAGQHDGYFTDTQAKALHDDIRQSRASILIVGLGAGRQEQFMRDAMAGGFDGVAFSCGGFIRQESMTNDYYYPALINRLRLRAFYRMYREPHTIKRYLVDYPVNFLRLLTLLVQRKVAINITAPLNSEL